MSAPSNGGAARNFQEEKESLHWISFNLKKLVEEMKNLNANLVAIKDKINVNVPF
jgi:hypothetical protein